MWKFAWIGVLLLAGGCEVSDTQKTATVGAGVKQEEDKQAQQRRQDQAQPPGTASQEARRDAQANQQR